MQHTLLNTGAVPAKMERFLCLYVIPEPQYHDYFGINTLQINTLSEPADMFFNLTESPWIRAGIQYSVRVGSPTPCGTSQLSLINFWDRICGRTRTTAPLCVASRP
jgi:hypothetical protein